MKTEKPENNTSRDLGLEKDSRYPESAYSKDQRKDAEWRDESDLEDLNEEIEETRESTKPSDPRSSDRAGVSDLDSGMGRADKV